jgi:membrane associated rhomboid family serine protease
MAALFLLTFWLWSSVLQTTAQTEHIKLPDELPSPSMLVSFERLSLRENDSLWIEVLIVNGSEYELTNLDLRIAGPEHFNWHADSCAGAKLEPNLSLGTVQARSTLTRRLCLKTDSEISVGEFNVLFVLKYQMGGGTATSLVTNEKTVKAYLFGSESIAGIPLALAGFIVPGLIFWLFVGWFKAPWGIDLPLSDKMIYSVLVSLVFIALGSQLNFLNKYLNIGNGISVAKLFWLAVTGCIFGVVLGGFDYTRRKAQQKRADERQINVGDDDFTLLRKLMLLYPNAEQPRAIIRLKDKTAYVGSLAARTVKVTVGSPEREIIHSMVGWFEINLQQGLAGVSQEIKDEITRLNHENQLVKLLAAAERYKIIERILVLTNAIQEIKEDASLESTGWPSRQWKDEEVSGIEISEGDETRPPLEAAKTTVLAASG